VAEIETIERETDAFARIHCRPIAAVEQSTRVLILGREVLPPPRPESAIEVAPARARPAARAAQRAGRRNRE
ncbi:MAG: hypothetical protein LBB76_11105, partial [Azoarcus sp.]|nr:hypothetical protein [Azoarcus sp.]